jgi:hypothetical protein
MLQAKLPCTIHTGVRASMLIGFADLFKSYACYIKGFVIYTCMFVPVYSHAILLLAHT